MYTCENTPFFHASVIRWAERCEPGEILDPEGHPIGARKTDPSAAIRKDIDGLACVAKSSGRIRWAGRIPEEEALRGMTAARE